MKPRTKFEKQVAASNERLTAITPKAVEWAVKTVIKHPGFRASSGLTTCGDCGRKFRLAESRVNVMCPQCGRRLEIKNTLKRSLKGSAYFAVLNTIDGLQVERVFLLTVLFKKGALYNVSNIEICRRWLNAKGQSAVTSKTRLICTYRDCFNFCSHIELRKMSPVHHVISNTWVYPRYNTIPELKRNGMKGSLPDCHPYELMKELLRDTRIETLMKARNHKAVSYFLDNKNMLDKCWHSHKIAMRNGYKIDDYGLWCDLISLLEKAGKDIRSTKYICPNNLRTAHDMWLKKITTEEERRRKSEELIKAQMYEAEFYKTKSRFFGIIIKDSDIEVSVLDSIEAYQTEGESMHHCVFRNNYYNRQNSIILSARDREGNRIETVEYSLTEHKVIQSRGLCNSNTEYHDRIINLVNANAHRFIKAQATA